MSAKKSKGTDGLVMPRSALAMRNVQRAGAGAGTHGDRRTKRMRTRGAQNRSARAEFGY